MDGIEQFRQDALEGRVALQQVIELNSVLQSQLNEAHKQNQQLQKRIEELEQQLELKTTKKIEEPFSLDSEEKRQQARGKKKPKRNKSARRGRIPNAQKRDLAQRIEQVYPKHVAEESCWLSHTRYVWRLENGQAVLVAYEIYRHGSQYGRIPGALGRSEYGLEIILAIAFEVYLVGLSFDKVCLMMDFFQGLKLSKSQVDKLLYRLSQEWEKEFDYLCSLLANSAVVHADETSWSINSVWAFLSENARLLVFGVHKDAKTLKQFLAPETFAGILISDHAAVYGKFTQAQKCWAHLLRKAIKISLLAPEETRFRESLDELLAIYRAACQLQKDRRYSEDGRRKQVAALRTRLLDLIIPTCVEKSPKLKGAAEDHRLLCNELMRLWAVDELFTFVTAPEVTQPNGETQSVSGTNNESERTLRGPAQCRVTGRTNKTVRGARRQTVIVSVLESLRVYVSEFTLSALLAEIQDWWENGESCFAKLAEQCNLKPPSYSPLDELLPLPEG